MLKKFLLFNEQPWYTVFQHNFSTIPASLSGNIQVGSDVVPLVLDLVQNHPCCSRFTLRLCLTTSTMPTLPAKTARFWTMSGTIRFHQLANCCHMKLSCVARLYPWSGTLPAWGDVWMEAGIYCLAKDTFTWSKKTNHKEPTDVIFELQLTQASSLSSPNVYLLQFSSASGFLLTSDAYSLSRSHKSITSLTNLMNMKYLQDCFTGIYWTPLSHLHGNFDGMFQKLQNGNVHAHNLLGWTSENH